MRLMSFLLGLLLFAMAGMTRAEEMRGLLVFGHEARTLQMCGDQRVFWLHASGSLHERLKSQYLALATAPYEPLYVELEGKILDHPVGSFAEDYDGTIEVSKLQSISRVDADVCRSKKPTDTPKSAPADEARTYVFLCGEDAAYTVRATESEAWVFRPEGTLQLPAVSVAQGTKYTDGAFELWIDAEQARLGDAGSVLLSCRNDRRRAIWERAKLDGVDFRAVGNEPGWHLEILEGSRILLVAGYGESQVELPLPEPTVDAETRITRWDAGELVLEVLGHPCRDSMSGESFEATVVVIWGEQTLQGCGRALH